MKVLVIPDSHLQKEIFELADKIMQKYNYDSIVVLGDILDSHDSNKTVDDYEVMLQTCVEFAKKYKSKLIWLYGNHEVGYMEPGCFCSEHNLGAEPVVSAYLLKLQDILGDRLKVAARIGNILFSHAGICEMYSYLFASTKDEEEYDAIIDSINRTRYKTLWEPHSPLWHRPNSLYLPYGIGKCIQVVGHTPFRAPHKFQNALFTDTFFPGGAGLFPVIDTEHKAVCYIDKTLSFVQDYNTLL